MSVKISRKCPVCKKEHKVEIKAFSTKDAKIKSFYKAEEELNDLVKNCGCKE